MANDSDFNTYIDRWALVRDGDPIITHSSRLLPVLRNGEPTMLKIATDPEEKWGAGLMIWWDGVGAARVIEHADDAILLERATGNRSLVTMAQHGADDEASHIICNVVAALHLPRTSPPPDLIPLSNWFQALMARHESEILDRSAGTARVLLTNPRDVVPLHGDIHHGNILEIGGGSPLIQSDCRASAALTTPTSSAIRNILSPPLPVASCGKWKWLPMPHSWSAAGCCNGS
jgi:streptomycin 6-kinase